MTIDIYWNDEYKEVSLPFISLTKSKSGETGTATFIFLHPTLLQVGLENDSVIEKMSICLEKKKFSTRDIEVLFWEGKPYLLKSIFLFKNLKEWFEFLTILVHLSKQTGLIFFSNNAVTKNFSDLVFLEEENQFR